MFDEVVPIETDNLLPRQCKLVKTDVHSKAQLGHSGDPAAPGYVNFLETTFWFMACRKTTLGTLGTPKP